MLTRARLPSPQVVIIQPVDNGNKSHPYGHALVAGIERYPSKITRRMSKTRQEKRSKIKPFVKVVNYNHLMPTRYTLELEGLKNVLTADTFKEVSQREDAKKTVKKTLEERYTSGKNRWFFTPLRTSQHTTPDGDSIAHSAQQVELRGAHELRCRIRRLQSRNNFWGSSANTTTYRILDAFPFDFGWVGANRSGLDVYSIT